MYAIIKDRGKQYKVSPGECLLIDLMKGLKEKDPIEFSEVIAVGDESNTRIGNPLVAGAKVLAEVECGDMLWLRLHTPLTRYLFPFVVVVVVVVVEFPAPFAVATPSTLCSPPVCT